MCTTRLLPNTRRIGTTWSNNPAAPMKFESRFEMLGLERGERMAPGAAQLGIAGGIQPPRHFFRRIPELLRNCRMTSVVVKRWTSPRRFELLRTREGIFWLSSCLAVNMTGSAEWE